MTPADTAFSLQSYRWDRRILLMFAPSSSSEALQTQLSALRAVPEDVDERKLLILRVLGQGQSFAGEQPISAEAASQLRSRFDVRPDQYRLIFVGLDGTEKRREAEPITAESLFVTIDAMPMRQREMQRQSDDGGGR